MIVELFKSYVKVDKVTSNKSSVFVFKVIGEPAELDLYKQDRGDLYCEDHQGNVLWFTRRPEGIRGTLNRTKSGNYYATFFPC